MRYFALLLIALLALIVTPIVYQYRLLLSRERTHRNAAARRAQMRLVS